MESFTSSTTYLAPAVARKTHPLLGLHSNSYCTSSWGIDFEHPISQLFQGKVSLDFLCCGEVDGEAISLYMEPYALKYPKIKSKLNTMEEAEVEAEKSSVNIRISIPNSNFQWSVTNDQLFEFISSVQYRFNQLSTKAIRGYGGSSILIDGEDVSVYSVDDPELAEDYIAIPYEFKDFQDYSVPEKLLNLKHKYTSTHMEIFAFDRVEEGEPLRVRTASLELKEALKKYYEHHDPQLLKDVYNFNIHVNNLYSRYWFNASQLDEMLFKKYGGKRFLDFQNTYETFKTMRGYKRYYKSLLNPQELYDGNISDANFLGQSRNPDSYTLIIGTSYDFVLPPECTDYSTLIVLRYNATNIAFIDAESVEKRNQLIRSLAPVYIRQLPLSLVESISHGTTNCADVENMLKHTKPSSFGVGEELVYDENIRKGCELLPDQLSLDIGDVDRMMTTIKNSLFPEASEIRGEFSKAAFYDAGGHFDVHRDTVHNEYHQGTLLIEIVSDHTGGDLVLEMNGQKFRWSLENRPSSIRTEDNQNYDIEIQEDDDQNHYDKKETNQEKDKNIEDDDAAVEEDDAENKKEVKIRRPMFQKVNFIAFYTDVIHAVEPVTSGTRAVLQFNIYALYNKNKTGGDEHEQDDDLNDVPAENEVYLSMTQDSIDKYYSNEEDEENKDNDDKNKSFFEKAKYFDVKKMNEGMISHLVSVLNNVVTDEEGVAFPLLHLYTNTQVLIQTLKQGDRQMFQACLQAGYCVQIIPILIEAISTIRGSFTDSKGKRAGRYFVSSIPSVLTESDIGFILNDTEKDDGIAEESNKISTAEEEEEMDVKTTVKIVNMIDPKARLKSGKHYPSITYAATGFEKIEVLDSKPASDWTGNEPAPAQHKYFSVACVVTTRNAIRRDDDEEEESEEEDEEEDVVDNNMEEEVNSGCVEDNHDDIMDTEEDAEANDHEDNNSNNNNIKDGSSVLDEEDEIEDSKPKAKRIRLE